MQVEIKKSSRKGKKMMAVFYDANNSKVKTTHFGTLGYDDYTTHKDVERKERYIQRHKSNENWNDPMSAGCLSRFILWNKLTLNTSINDYCKKFLLKKK